MSETKIASAIALATLAGVTYYVVNNWEFEGTPQNESQDQGQDQGQKQKMIDPRDKEENKSLVDMSGKKLEVENPNYTESTKFGKLFKNYGLKYKVVIDSAGTTAEGSDKSSDIIVDFEPIPTNWTASGFTPKTIIRQVASGTSWDSVQKPTFQELLTAVGGVRTDGPYIGPSVLFSSIIERRPNGEVAMIPMTGQGKRESNIRLDIVTGRPNPAFTLGMYIKCGMGSYEWIQGSSSPIGGSYDEASNRWNYSVAIPASAMTALNAKCPPDVKTVQPPLEIGVDDGVTTSTGGISWTPYVLSGSPTTTTLTLDTTEKALLYSMFYSRSKPNVWRNASGQLIVKEQGIEVIIPHQYIKKTYECDCPSESVKSGQKVSMPMECSKYDKFAVLNRYEELITACGGRPAPPTGPVLGGNNTVPAFAESGSHQSFMTEFL